MPPPFPPRFGGPPLPHGFQPGPFRGLPPPPSAFPPFPSAFPPPPPWQQPPQQAPLPWRPLQAAERPSPAPGSSSGLETEKETEEEAWLLRFVSQARSEPEKKKFPEPPPVDLGLPAFEALLSAARASAGEKELQGKEEGSGEASARERSRKKRLRRRRQRQENRAAGEEEQARQVEEEEARIERWRARRAQEDEQRRREKELKAAADSVLSEVRKKQADTKRMAEILRGLEKLRKLRKEAAGRKGVCPPAAADEAFENEVQSLRASIKKRTELYDAEERALRVMLEGEQEEERKRDLERKQRKEREKLMQQKREMNSKLFGDPDEFPLTHILEPFTQYYLQAEYSVPALIQIRHEWDRFLVLADHPEGQGVPPGWVLPSPPSSDIWATAVR
ncbi:programmed cell death protein 7 isoform X1 [Anolis carolinensis]|uniref:Programmed cell death 7 n=1 Tax=Anolis carolinensis TaxID=28377 RepID=A0A803TE12_ANOCA|nr:PREDICTED: programmed cell death protein 7 isoform X1 [Anolis carolinensis]|eukprot:XP_003226617.1 PREDICTED: programmed cell death protein 7 isoform X1 [Anolis carolinensis]